MAFVRTSLEHQNNVPPAPPPSTYPHGKGDLRVQMKLRLLIINILGYLGEPRVISRDLKNGKGTNEELGVIHYESNSACHCDFEDGGRGP